jgi:hypothetical protein
MHKRRSRPINAGRTHAGWSPNRSVEGRRWPAWSASPIPPRRCRGPASPTTWCPCPTAGASSTALGYEDNWWDPYNQNTIKGDKPVHGDWFFNVTVISDTVLELREVPTPVGVRLHRRPRFTRRVRVTPTSGLFNQNLAVELVYYQGDTVFKPPDWEFRFTPVFNYNYTELDEILGVNANPGRRGDPHDNHVGIQAAFIDKHLRDVSDRYDFDSVRVGIQPFSSDFRGFLFQDAPFGVRLFGTRDNNRLPVQPGLVPAHGEGHQQRPQRPRREPARRRRVHRQRLLAGLPDPGLLLPGHGDLQPQP